MNIDQHSAVLNAYLSRLSLADLRAILDAARYSHDATFNQGASEQLRRDLDMRQVVREAVEGMIQHDRDLIHKAVCRNIGGEPAPAQDQPVMRQDHPMTPNVYVCGPMVEPDKQ